MKALTFYSYKGGVGRTLAMVNIAMRLAEFGKKVVLLDFDLEAPGVHFKLKNHFPVNMPKAKNGIVDYIYEFTENGNFYNKIKPYSYALPAINEFQKPIDVIPAGDVEDSAYWQKLARINWQSMFYEESGQGLELFLDLKQKIEKEFEPDFLLIDSRTGITDIAGITLKLLADEVIVLAANNDENLFGTKRIIKSLLDPEKSIFDKIPNISFVLTRLPNDRTPQEEATEYQLKTKLQTELKEILNIENFDINIIHSERDLGLSEVKISYLGNIASNSEISHDYTMLFSKLTSKYFDKEDIKRLEQIKKSELLYNNSLRNSIPNVKIEILTQAIDLYPYNCFYHTEIGRQYFKVKDFDKAINSFKLAYLYNKNIVEINNLIGNSYFQKSDYELAIKYFNKTIELSPQNENAYQGLAECYDCLGKYEKSIFFYESANKTNPYNVLVLNGLANGYRRKKEFNKALEFINQAIQLKDFSTDSNITGILFATRAEIYADQGSIDLFYFDITKSLNNGITSDNLKSEKEVYAKFKNEERFIDLIAKHGININDILN